MEAFVISQIEDMYVVFYSAMVDKIENMLYKQRLLFCWCFTNQFT